MDAYRKQIKIRICLLSILDFIFVGLLIYDQFGADPLRKGSTVFSFLCGLAAAGTLLISAKIIQYRKILHASTTSGSYFIPFSRSISSRAFSIPNAARYGRWEAIASTVSATPIIRAIRCISLPFKPFGYPDPSSLS